jgi:uncharacterized membrane protein
MLIKSKKINTFILFSWIVLFSLLFVTLFSPIHYPFTNNNSLDTSITTYLITGNQNNLIGLEQSEISHMFDVRILIIIAFCLFIITNIFLFNKDFKIKAKEKFEKKLLTKILIIFDIISILSLIFFNLFFTLFHKILFPQGNWIFSSNSLLIQTYPESFFVWMFILIFLSINILNISLIITKKN